VSCVYFYDDVVDRQKLCSDNVFIPNTSNLMSGPPRPQLQGNLKSIDPL